MDTTGYGLLQEDERTILLFFYFSINTDILYLNINKKRWFEIPIKIHILKIVVCITLYLRAQSFTSSIILKGISFC